MRFGRQKLFIALCLLAIPPTGMLALLETPELSTIVLKLSLRFARLRTGLKIDANAWHVSPLTFSAKLEGVKVSLEKAVIDAPRVEVWVSPVALLVGRLNFSEIELADANIKIDDPNILSKNPFESDPKDPPSKFWKGGDFGDDYPKLLGALTQDTFARLHTRNIDFDDLRLTNIGLQAGMLDVKGFSFLLNNLQEGQLRAEWNLDALKVERGLQTIEKFGGSVSLLKTKDQNYQLYLGEVVFTMGGANTETVRVRGAWPGEVVADVELQMRILDQWALQSPWLKSKYLKGQNAGSLSLKTTAKLSGTHLVTAKTEVLSKDLLFDGFHLNRIDARANFSFRDTQLQWDISKLNIILPVVKGVEVAWKNAIDLKDLKIQDGKILTNLEFSEASLCGILIAASEKECQVGVHFTGPLKVEGSLEPLRLKVEPDWRVSAGPVMSDPYIVAASEPVVQLKPSRLSGVAIARDKDLIFEKMKMTWQDKNTFNIEGNLEYVPTKLKLSVKGVETRLDEVMTDLVGLRFGGASNIDGDIYYDISLEKSKRTRIEAQIRSPSFHFEDQDFGSISGPIRYEDRILFLGPYQMRSGGGTALVQGSLSPNAERGSFLSLVVQANRFEFSAYTDASRKSEAFRGFVSGRGTLNGFVDTTRHPNNGLRGDLNFRARNFRAFDIPFAEAELQGIYQDRDLKVQRLIARKDGARLSLKGILSPKGGSELIFESEPIPMRNIEIEPKLAIFEKGLVEINGFWRPDEGWGVKGQVQGASVAGQTLGSGTVNISGTNEKLDVEIGFGDLFHVRYEGIYKKEELLIDRLEAKLKDAGIYAGFAYLGDWKQPMPVEAQGHLSFLWRPREGYFETKNLKIHAPHLTESRKELVLDVAGEQKLVWNGSGVVTDTLNWRGPSTLTTRSRVGGANLGVDADLALGLVKLFLPAVDLRAGRAILSGTIPLSPHFSNITLNGRVANGVLRVPGVAGAFDQVNLDLDMQRSQLGIRRGTLRSGSGTVRVSGVYRVDFEKPAADLTLELDGAQMVLLEDVPTLLNGELQIRGEKLPYMMSGRVVVNEALYGQEFGSTPEDVGDVVVEPALKFDIDVEFGQGTRVRNSLVSSEIRGRIKILGNNIAPELRGDMVLSSGSIFANQTEFSILQSRIQFYGAKDNLPIVNMRANTTIRYSNTDYKIELNARGPGDNLSIEFTSDPALSNQDVVSLLAFGLIRDEETNDLASAAQAEAFQAIFGRAIGNSLSKSTGFDVRLKAATSTAGKIDNIPKVSVMRRLSERVTARFARSLDIDNKEKDAQVDYRLLNNVNLSGVWESPTPEETSLGVDLRFRFEIE